MSVLRDKIALVTGSSRGIGGAIAKLFAEQGAAVAVHGRNHSAIAAVHAAITERGGRAIQVAADVTRFTDVESMRLQIEKELGPIDIVVANAGATLTRPHQPVEEIDEEGWRASIDANLTATYLTMKSVLPGMKERRRGNIVTMSSAAARRPTALSPIPYVAAKAGVQLLSQIVAAQAGPFGIRVNCIAPETILSDSNETRMPEAVQARLAAEHPLGRLGTPDDVAQAALYLASDASGWLTGVVLDVAGGAVMR